MRFRRRVKVRRIVLGVVSVTGSAALLAFTYYAGLQTGTFRERRTALRPQLSIRVWTGGTSRWSMLDSVDKWGVTTVASGDAFPVYWPGGDTNADSPCPRSAALGFNAPAWTQHEASLRAAAACDRIEEVVRAAHMSDVDFTAWLEVASRAGSGIESQAAFNVFRRPSREITSVLARAHWRIVAGDLDGAESDARAVVSSALRMIRNMPETTGMFFGFAIAGSGLDHLREIHERRNDPAAVAGITDAQLTVASLRATFTNFIRRTSDLATLPEAGDRFAEFALSPEYPVGMRTHAASLLGYAWVKHPREIVLGPSPARRAAVEAMTARPELVLAVSQARQGLDMPVRERLRFARMAL